MVEHASVRPNKHMIFSRFKLPVRLHGRYSLFGKVVERVGRIELPTQPWEGRVLPLNHTRRNRLAVYLVALVVASAGLSWRLVQAAETPAFDYHAGYVEWGKTFVAGSAKAGIFPNGLTGAAQVTWTIHEGILPPVPPHRAVLGNVYRLSIDGPTQINSATPRPLAIALPFGTSNWIRQIWVYDLDAKIWNPLPTKLNTANNLGQAPAGIQRGLYAILEDRHQLEGTASYYCLNVCSTSASTMYAATNAYPVGTALRIRNLQNGKTATVKVVSTWAGTSPHVIDLHLAAFSALGGSRFQGIMRVNASIPGNVLGVTAGPVPSKIETIPKLNVVNTASQPFPAIAPRPFFILDQGSGTVLAEHQPDTVVPVASLTKLMTAAVFLDTKTDLRKVYTYSTNDQTPYGYLRVKPGETLTVRDLFYALLVGSANNAATALAHSAGLSLEEFVARMNAKAKALGLTKTSFVDVHGLDPRNVSTARDMAIMTGRILHDYEPIRFVTVRREYIFSTINTGISHTLKTTDKLLGSTLINSNLIITGGKTGYIDESKYTYTLRVAEKNTGAQVVVVLLGSETSNLRFNDAAAMANWAFKNYKWQP